MNTGKIVWFLILLALVGISFFAFKKDAPVVNNFEDCKNAGYPIMESYPEQCRTPDGRNFVNESQVVEHEMIHVDFPKANDTVGSPLVVKGEARGGWYFEASFPLALTKEDGTVIKEWYAQAQGEWMTNEFVPFEGTLEFENQPAGSKGFLILKKDNPSGLPEHDDSIKIPIIFDAPSSSESNVVEKYVRENIATLAPEDEVLGGTWYVVEISIDEASNTGDVTYEDGHTQGSATFSYTITNGEVVLSNMSKK